MSSSLKLIELEKSHKNACSSLTVLQFYITLKTTFCNDDISQTINRLAQKTEAFLQVFLVKLNQLSRMRAVAAAQAVERQQHVPTIRV